MFKAAIYFCLASARRGEWIGHERVAAHLDNIRNFRDDCVEKGMYLTLGQSGPLDSDYRRGAGRQGGVSLTSFRKDYSEWLQFCADGLSCDVGSSDGIEEERDLFNRNMCWFFSVSILQRRLMAAFTPGIYCIDPRVSARDLLFPDYSH